MNNKRKREGRRKITGIPLPVCVYSLDPITICFKGERFVDKKSHLLCGHRYTSFTERLIILLDLQLFFRVQGNLILILLVTGLYRVVDVVLIEIVVSIITS